ncbi:hypothetical protein EVG20_g6739 [Dentipellis fragilis]|uniref:Uncharacterized protein n=1 Tax=Dentipellis fragilis TaxID=205917 RepID=A0A4Y9YKK1_9AGAM|nr:hypothetical protein EVG20_g6739 [Dentipellis fragilis]
MRAPGRGSTRRIAHESGDQRYTEVSNTSYLVNSMFPYHIPVRHRALQSAQRVGSTQSYTQHRSENSYTGTGEQLIQSQHPRVYSSYRCHTLLQEYDAIMAELAELTRERSAGLINSDEHKLLDARCMARQRAVGREIDEELDAERPGLRGIIQDWGYTDKEAAQMARESADEDFMRGENTARSSEHFLSRRDVKGH